MAAKTDAIRKLVEERLAELDEERTQLVDALAALDGRKGPGRPRGSGGSGRRSKNPSRSSNAPRPGRRRRKGGTRAEHAEKAITAEPGITASQVAEQLKIKPNYVYRVMSKLEDDGKVTKKGREYHPAASAS